MPQMAPLSWLLLFIMFSMALITFNTLNYYMFMPQSPKTQKSNNISIKSMVWKW